MVGDVERLAQTITPLQLESEATGLPDFRALHHYPIDLGHRAHVRLQEITGVRLATDDAAPEVNDAATAQQSGLPMGDLVGRRKAFTENLPKIETNVEAIAERRKVPVAQVWDEIVEVMSGSKIGEPMYRALNEPLGGAYGAKEYIEHNADGGILLYVRGGIHNWEMIRIENLVTTIGILSTATRQKVRGVALGGSDVRIFKGDTELWQPEVAEFVIPPEPGKEKKGPTSNLTEAGAFREVYDPKVKKLLTDLGLSETVEVKTLAVPSESGSDVMRAIGQAYAKEIGKLLVVGVGNSPAGYQQMADGLLLAKEFGVDPFTQFVAVSPNRVDVVQPDVFKKLSLQDKSRRQNGATALNAFNGWQRAITQVNSYAHDRIFRSLTAAEGPEG
jgi:hypothetical protein